MPTKQGGLRGSLRNVSTGVSAIPDSGDLQARYDASELSLSAGETVSTFADETGNGYDLSATGSPEYQEASDGSAYVLYDGSNDFHQHTQPLGVQQPAEVWAVIQLETADGTRQDIMSGQTSNNYDSYLLLTSQNGSEFEIYSGDFSTGPSEDTSRHVFGGVFDGGSSAIDFDGAENTTGDAGRRDLDQGWRIGASFGQDARANVRVYEVLQYQSRDDERRPDIRSYLNDKWSVF